MVAMSGSGKSARGATNFSRSAALRFAGDEGGGAGVVAGAVAGCVGAAGAGAGAEGVWPTNTGGGGSLDWEDEAGNSRPPQKPAARTGSRDTIRFITTEPV